MNSGIKLPQILIFSVYAVANFSNTISFVIKNSGTGNLNTPFVPNAIVDAVVLNRMKFKKNRNDSGVKHTSHQERQ